MNDEEARREDHGQRQVADEPLAVGSRPAELDHVGGQERGGDHEEVDEHLDEPAPVDGEGLREPERLAELGGPAVDVGEEARELDEQHERQRRRRRSCSR